MEFMKDHLQIKKNLYEACLLFTNNRFETVTKVIESNKKRCSQKPKVL